MKTCMHFKVTLVCIRVTTRPNSYQINESILLRLSIIVVNSVTPATGSTAGGTVLTINGDYFSNSVNYPLQVTVAGEPCTIVSSTGTTILCQTPALPASIQNRYQGWLE
jgi:hypothetical protein